MSIGKNALIENPFLMWIRSELSQRMAQNLPFIKITPQKILLNNLISNTCIKELSKTYSSAQFHADFRPQRSNLEKIFPFKSPSVKPISPATRYDLLWSCNTILTKSPHFEQQINNWFNTVADNGLLMMAYLGPDTAKEFHVVLAEKPSMIDMHDLGDLLVHAGFSDPVMTMEYITLEYEDLEVLKKELNTLLGEIYVPHDPTQKAFWENDLALSKVNGCWQLTLEVVYGHAWKVPKMRDKVVTIDANSIRTKNKSD